MLNGLDLFSGIGGITEGLAGYVLPLAYCENDPHAQADLVSRIYRGELPSAPIWDDVRTLRAVGLPEVDIIYGGFPCQDISTAGRGGGLEGKRSGLYWQIHRLVKECEPSFVFLENVPAIRTRGLDTVVRSLTDLGYDCRWWDVEPDVGRVAYGVPLRSDRLRGLGNSVVPLQARIAFERLIGFRT